MAIKVTVLSSDEKSQVIVVESTVIKIGKLPNNQIILNDDSVEPIHAILYQEKSRWVVENVVEDSTIFLNENQVKSSQQVVDNDEIKVGSLKIKINSLNFTGKIIEESADISTNDDKKSDQSDEKESTDEETEVSEAAKEESSSETIDEKKEERASSAYPGERRRRSDLLFKPREAKSTGAVLEVVNYWDDRILGIEHFTQDKTKKNNVIFIGPSEKAHFSSSQVFRGRSLYKICEYTSDIFTLYLAPGMTGRIRKEGVYTSVGPGSHHLRKGDVAHIQYNNTRFFFIHMRVPNIKLPPEKIEDPLFVSLLTIFLALYLLLCAGIYVVETPENNDVEDDVWSVVEIESEFDKNKVKFDSIERKKIFEDPPKAKLDLLEQTTKNEPKKSKPKHDRFQHMEQFNKSLTQKTSGTNLTNQTSKLSGKRKGDDKTDKSGAEDGKSKQSSGLNLSLVGLGIGKVSSGSGLGAIHVDLKSSSGGAGMGSGSQDKSFGLGGVGSDMSSVDMSGLNAAAMNFGQSTESIASADLTSGGFKRTEGAAKVQVRSGDPLIGAGIDKEGVWNVLTSAQRAINHCYNTLLQRNPKASGTVTILIIVGLDGRATSSRVRKSEISDKTMQGCMLKVIKRLKFPKPQGGTEVEFKMPYGFSPE